MPKELDEIYKRVCALTGEKLSSKVDNKKSVLIGLKKLEATLKSNKKSRNRKLKTY